MVCFQEFCCQNWMEFDWLRMRTPWLVCMRGISFSHFDLLTAKLCSDWSGNTYHLPFHKLSLCPQSYGVSSSTLLSLIAIYGTNMKPTLERERTTKHVPCRGMEHVINNHLLAPFWVKSGNIIFSPQNLLLFLPKTVKIGKHYYAPAYKPFRHINKQPPPSCTRHQARQWKAAQSQVLDWKGKQSPPRWYTFLNIWNPFHHPAGRSNFTIQFVYGTRYLRRKNCFLRPTGDNFAPPPGDGQPSNSPGEDGPLACDEVLLALLPVDLRPPVSVGGDAASENEPNWAPLNPPADEGGDSIIPSPPFSPKSPVMGDRFLLEGGPPPPISVAMRRTSPAPGVNVCW